MQIETHKMLKKKYFSGSEQQENKLRFLTDLLGVVMEELGCDDDLIFEVVGEFERNLRDNRDAEEIKYASLNINKRIFPWVLEDGKWDYKLLRAL